MTLLIILALLSLLAVYAVFFLLFKLVWILMKKNSNKWPLIWAGVSTVIFGTVLIGLSAWGVYKVVSPFRGMLGRLSENPTPVYGERIYTDPVYRFQLNVFNGMDFSEWMELDDVNVKIGGDMNSFRDFTSPEEKEAAEKEFVAVILLRQEDVDDGHPLQDMREILASLDNQRRDVEILSQEDFLADGYPAMLVTGRIYTRDGQPIFFSISAIADVYQQVFYAVSFSPENPTAVEYAEKTVRSLRLENGSSLPAAADPALMQDTAAAVPTAN